MLCVFYLRRRLVFAGLLLWITTLLFAFSFLAEEADMTDPTNIGSKTIMRLQELRVNPPYQPPDHYDDLSATSMPGHVGIVQETKHVNANRKVLVDSQMVDKVSIVKRNSMSHDPAASSRDTSVRTEAPPISYYCNREGALATSQEGIAPQGYNLVSVHVITRHGDRSPMYTFNRHSNPRLSCQFDPQEVMKDARLAAYVTTMRGWEGHQREDSGFMSWALYPSRKVCDISQLSAIGAKQMLNLGYFMHERYVQKWNLFGNNFRAEQVLPRSTEYSRTYQSAIAFLYAFLPRFNLTDMHVKRVSNLFFCSEQTLAAPCTCPVLRSLKKQADALASSAVRNSTGYDTLMNAVADMYDMPVSRLPRLWAMMDVLLSHSCNSLPLPCNKQGQCITPRQVSELWGHVTNYTKYLVTDERYQKYASLALHPLLTEIVEQMQDAAHGVTKTKFYLLSGHDATLAPLTAVFGTGTGTWPRYASRYVLELYSRKDISEHYIRVLHDGKDVTRDVTFCHGHIQDGMCPFKRFADFVLRDNLRHFDETDYINLCYSPS